MLKIIFVVSSAMTKLYLISLEMRWLHGRLSYWAVEETHSWSRKKSVVTFWNVILCHVVSSQKTSNDSHHYENFKWHKVYPTFMRLEDLSLSLTWHSYICPKPAQTIFLIVILLLPSTYTCLPCSSSHVTSFAKILYPVPCSA